MKKRIQVNQDEFQEIAERSGLMDILVQTAKRQRVNISLKEAADFVFKVENLTPNESEFFNMFNKLHHFTAELVPDFMNHNTALIKKGMDYESRKSALNNLADELTGKLFLA